MRSKASWSSITVTILIHSALGAEPNIPNRGKSIFRSSKSSFQPQSHVQVENYKYTTGNDQEEMHSKSNLYITDKDSSGSSPQLQDFSTCKQYKTANPVGLNLRERFLKQTQSMSLPFDDVDRMIFKTALPLSAVFAIIPVVSALDLFWVNRLGDALAVAGQAAANQVYNTFFWLFAFLPTITATLVSKSHASGDIEKTQDSVCQAMLFSLMIASTGSLIMFFNPTRVLSSILKAGSPALQTARPYLKVRAFSFIPMMISFIGFSTFRGTMEISSAVKITMATSLLSASLDPLLIHVLGFGVKGSALAGLCAEYTSAAVYIKLLLQRNLLRLDKLTRLPKWGSVAPLIKGSIALQIRSFALNLTQLAVARVIQSIDDEGVAPAAHALALQAFQLGGILFGALGMATQTLVPNSLGKQEDAAASKTSAVGLTVLVGRLLKWGFSLGVLVSSIQFFFLPNILKSSPLMKVREVARVPALISISLQSLNAVVSIGEGTMVGCGDFMWLSANIVTAALGYMASLQFLPHTFGLSGVWMSFVCFTAIRLVGSLIFLSTKLASKQTIDSVT